MKLVQKSVLLWYSAQEMYELVTAVESYPQFLPWCAGAQVLERQDAGLTARLDLAFAGVHSHFTTRNAHTAGERVQVSLVDGPFSLLDGDWQFKALKRPGAELSNACKVLFELRYAFKSGALEAALSPVFDKVAQTFVDRFVARAESVYGPR